MTCARGGSGKKQTQGRGSEIEKAEDDGSTCGESDAVDAYTERRRNTSAHRHNNDNPTGTSQG